MSKSLEPVDVLIDLFDSDEWDAVARPLLGNNEHPIPESDRRVMAETVLRRLVDAGFTVWEDWRVPENSR